MISTPTSTSKLLRTFSFAFLIVFSAKVARGLSKQRKTKLSLAAVVFNALESSTVKAALFPTVFPRIYRALRSLPSPVPAEAAASLALLLLPPYFRKQIALYTATTSLQLAAHRSRFQPYLPPVWTLNVIGNAWLLWAFLFESDAFPNTYRRVIIGHSTHYVPKGMSAEELEKILTTTAFARNEGGEEQQYRKHTFELCCKLHPDEPSCVKNYLDAWMTECKRVWKWVGAFGALSILLSKRQAAFRQPSKYIRQWVLSTLQGTGFVVGSINTSWALVCLLQRLLPANAIPKFRFLINGSVSSLFILLLPPKRREAIALYVARLSALSLWDAWQLRLRHDDGSHRKEELPFFSLAECFLFGAAWTHLAHLRRSEGLKIGGPVGAGLALLDRLDYSPLQNDRAL